MYSYIDKDANRKETRLSTGICETPGGGRGDTASLPRVTPVAQPHFTPTRRPFLSFALQSEAKQHILGIYKTFSQKGSPVFQLCAPSREHAFKNEISLLKYW